ncbi:MAG: YgjV family protein [Sphingomonas bacterium]|nr:YgjV family protein [Sphingomonas bacterium]
MLLHAFQLFEQTKGVQVGFGFAGLICVLIWPLLRSYRGAVATQSAGAAAFAVHFALLGSPTASAMCLISFAQLLFTASIKDRKAMVTLYAATVVLMAVLLAFTWHGTPSLLVAFGSIAGTAARLQRSTVRMKTFFLIGAPFWLAHNLLLGAPLALGVDVVSIIGNSASLLRLSKRSAWTITSTLRCVSALARRGRHLLARAQIVGPSLPELGQSALV